jgi:hypothetical protein
MYDPAVHVHHPNWCYCVSCTQWFTSDSAFDAHLGPIPEKGRPECKLPQDVRKGKEHLTYDPERQAWRWAGRENPFATPREAA